MLAEDKGLLKNNLIKKAGIGRGFFDKMDGAVSDKQLAKIIAAFPAVNLEWLVTGRAGDKAAQYMTTGLIDLLVAVGLLSFMICLFYRF